MRKSSLPQRGPPEERILSPEELILPPAPAGAKQAPPKPAGGKPAAAKPAGGKPAAAKQAGPKPAAAKKQAGPKRTKRTKRKRANDGSGFCLLLLDNLHGLFLYFSDGSAEDGSVEDDREDAESSDGVVSSDDREDAESSDGVVSSDDDKRAPLRVSGLDLNRNYTRLTAHLFLY